VALELDYARHLWVWKIERLEGSWLELPLRISFQKRQKFPTLTRSNDTERFLILVTSNDKTNSIMARNKKLYENEDELVIYENGEERVLCGVFKDGYAVCTDSDTEEEVRVTYPKYSELTKAQIDEIEGITLRPLDAYTDIALVYGDIDGHEPQKTGTVC
jgi:hypothetical protein